MQFSLSRLFVIAALISVGLFGFAALFHSGIPMLEDWKATVVAITATGFIGAGVFHLFRLALVGAIIGAVAMIAFLVFAAIAYGPG